MSNAAATADAPETFALTDDTATNEPTATEAVKVVKPVPKPKAPAPKPKAAKPAPAPKTPAAKPAAAPKAKTTEVKKPGSLGVNHLKVLKVLAKGKNLSRAEISTAIGVGSGFTSLLGHLDPAAREPGSLAARGLIRPVPTDDGVVWAITAAGHKALTKA